MFRLKEFYQCRRELAKKNRSLRLRAPLKKKGSSPFGLGQGIVYLKSTRNNTIVTLTNLKGKVEFVSSCGALGFDGKKKRSTKFAIESTVFSVVRRVKELGWTKVVVYFSGFSRGRFYMLNCLKKGNLILGIVRDITPIPHNGCRPPKLRRG